MYHNLSYALLFTDCSIKVYRSFATCISVELLCINPFHIINFISCYASIMLNAFSDLLCSKLYWNNRLCSRRNSYVVEEIMTIHNV